MISLSPSDGDNANLCNAPRHTIISQPWCCEVLATLRIQIVILHYKTPERRKPPRQPDRHNPLGRVYSGRLAGRSLPLHPTIFFKMPLFCCVVVSARPKGVFRLYAFSQCWTVLMSRNQEKQGEMACWSSPSCLNRLHHSTDVRSLGEVTSEKTYFSALLERFSFIFISRSAHARSR
jgi:hypothetical protein